MFKQEIRLNKPEDEPISLAGLSGFSSSDKIVVSGYIGDKPVWKCEGMNGMVFYIDVDLQPIIKYCQLCESLVFIEGFYTDKYNKFGVMSCCKDCSKANSRAAYRKKKVVQSHWQ